MRTTFTLDADLAKRAQELGVNISAAARDGVMTAVEAAMAISDRLAYLQNPEEVDLAWEEAEAWGST